jgi:hypothetical protein
MMMLHKSDAQAAPRSASYAAHMMWAMAALSVALMGMGALWALFETRLLQGSYVWVKPFKFALSTLVFFVTLALVVQRLSRAVQGGRQMRAVAGALCISALFELGYITWQAALGQTSHFNDASVYHDVMYGLMALGAFTMVAGMAVIGVLALRDGGARMGAELRLGVGVGFVASFVLTLITAFTLGGNGGHFVGIPPQGAAVIPFFGWSAAVGDLRPSHFAALHAMQVIPLLAWAVQGRAHARALIWGGAGLYSALTLGLYSQAMLGLPMLRL